MKLNQLIPCIILFIFLIQPVGAYDWDNKITVGPDSMSWEYTESYSGDHSVIFKKFIDSDLGNDDGFVSAWELLKIDVKSRKTFSDSINEEMDVGIDDSSDMVKLLSVESDLSYELVGPVNSSRKIVNTYETFYSFDESLPSNGSIWFRGQSRTDVSVTMPEGFNITGYEGIDESKTEMEGTRETVSGTFGDEGVVTVNFVIFAAEAEEEISPEVDDTSETVLPGKSPSLLDDIFPGLTDRLSRKLRSDMEC